MFTINNVYRLNTSHSTFSPAFPLYTVDTLSPTGYGLSEGCAKNGRIGSKKAKKVTAV